MNFWPDKSTAFSGNTTLKCGSNQLLMDKPLVMGILNLTPDSFYDGGKFQHPPDWMGQTEKMIAEGAAIIDLGAVSTRPGAEAVSETEEIARLLPALEILAPKFPGTVFSVDTYRANVARLAFNAGAGIINDISGGALDRQMMKTVAETGLPYILMHMQGTPANMQLNPVYEDVTQDVMHFFEQKIKALQQAGILQIILDPGFGFGKTIQHNYQLLRDLHQFSKFNLPVLAGISRKSMIYKPLGITPADALPATTALHLATLLNGAAILRVHDVKEAVQAVKLCALYAG